MTREGMPNQIAIWLLIIKQRYSERAFPSWQSKRPRYGGASKPFCQPDGYENFLVLIVHIA